MAAIASSPDFFELWRVVISTGDEIYQGEAYPCPLWEWDGPAVFLMLKLTKDTGTRPEIVGIERLFTFCDLDYPPRDDEPIPLKAHMHVVLFDPRKVKDSCHR